MVRQTIDGEFAFKGKQYKYTADCEERGKDWFPGRIAELDRADGETLDGVDYEAVEEAAMAHAWLVNWCEDRGWEIEDSGGGCSALIREREGKVIRITKADDPTAPQSMDEPVKLGVYAADDDAQAIEEACFAGGISEIMASGLKSLII